MISMPHQRYRYAALLLKHILTYSPIAGILGQRQTGKTTLATAYSKEYETLDLRKNLHQAEEDPENFLVNRKHPFTIDECQMAPSIFPALKDQVRKIKKPGQFILTGSVRFTSRKAIRESLTGRIINLELLPLSYAESHEEPLPSFLIRYLTGEHRIDDIKVRLSWLNDVQKKFQFFLQTGGLPGICFFREAHIRASHFETHLETLLERDIRLLINTQLSYRQLKLLLSTIAISQGIPISFSALAKVIGTTTPTVRKVIQAMEGMFLIRLISTEKQNRPVAFLEDQGMATYLITEKLPQEADLNRGLFACILPQFLYRPETVSTFYQYRTRGGAKVSLAIKSHLGRVGILPVPSATPTSSAIASARSFIANSPQARAIIAHQGHEIRQISDSIVSLPFQLLISDSWLN